MVNFEIINQFIDNLEKSIIPEDTTFNAYVEDFYENCKLIPLSKYLHSINKDKRIPKILYSKKAGELLSTSKNDEQVKNYLLNNGFKEFPMLDFKMIMVLRKTDNLTNWHKIVTLIQGKGSIEEIINSTRVNLLPNEKNIITEEIKKELDLNDDELKWFSDKFKKLILNKKLKKSLIKLINSNVTLI